MSAELTVKVESTEAVPQGPPRGPASPSVQPPQRPQLIPTAEEAKRFVPQLGAPLGALPPVVQQQILEVWREEAKLLGTKAQAQITTASNLTGDVAELARKAIERDRRAMEVEMARREMGMSGVGTRGDVLLRERERREREAAGKPPHDDAWAAERAKDKMRREAEAEAIDKARRLADPWHALVRDQEEKAKEERARRAAERAEGPPIKAEIVKDKGWAAEQARKDMAREEESRRAKELLENERRRIDPVYAQKRAEEEAKEAAKRHQKEVDSAYHSIQKATFGAMALGAAGMPGLARIPAGYATGMEVGMMAERVTGASAGSLSGVGGIAGAVIGAVKYVMDKMVEMIQGAFKVGAAMISFDPERFTRGMADLVSKVPLVGGLFGALAHGVLDLGDAVRSTAQRLSVYSAQLSTQLAQQEVVRIQRDIFRAQRFGPQIAAAENARFRFEQKVEDFLDKYAPIFLGIAEKLLDFVAKIVDFPDLISRFAAEQIANVLQAFNAIFPGNFFGAVIQQLRRIAQNTDPEFQPGQEDPFIQELIAMRGGLAQLIPLAPQANQGFVGNAPALIGGQL